jgi:protein associated with RNAse G/E
MEHWKPGTQVVIRGVVHNRVWIAHSVTVVQDTASLLVTYLVPGAPCKVTQGLIERKWGGRPNGASRWDEQDSRQWKLADWEWKQRRALILMPPEKYYAVFLFWLDETDEFEGWYVNFQLPFRKTDWTIDTLDLEIDLIIEPDGVWRWKDEVEYQAGVDRGSIPANVAMGVEEGREEIIALLSSGSPLFDRQWLDWWPDPKWEIPRLHPAWDLLVDP